MVRAVGTRSREVPSGKRTDRCKVDVANPMKFLLLPVTVLIAVFVLHAADQRMGSIEGTVIDQHGDSVAGAWVSAFSATDIRPLGARIPSARADDKGHFVIRSLEWDEYGVQACKEEIGVPCGPLFYRGDTKLVRVTPQHPSATIKVRLGFKKKARAF